MIFGIFILIFFIIFTIFAGLNINTRIFNMSFWLNLIFESIIGDNKDAHALRIIYKNAIN